MNKTETQHNWSAFLKLFSRQNQNRPTRIGVFEGEPGAMTDYWVEDGLPLTGIDVDTGGSDAPSVEIMLGNMEKPDSPALTHTIAKARFIKIVLSAGGESDGLDIENEDGRTTILRFENQI
jgi:hypothetical protein